MTELPPPIVRYFMIDDFLTYKTPVVALLTLPSQANPSEMPQITYRKNKFKFKALFFGLFLASRIFTRQRW